MTYKQVDALLQWSATVFILAGHMLNSAGPATWPYNVFSFFIGTILFLAWAIRVKILAQIVVNAASIVITGAGVVAGVISFFK